MKTNFRQWPAWLLALGFAVCFARPVAGEAPAPRVVIADKAVAFVVAPFVGADGRLYAPANVVFLLGASFTGDAGSSTVTVTDADGEVLRFPCMLVRGRYCVALQQVAQALGDDADWQAASQVLTIRIREALKPAAPPPSRDGLLGKAAQILGIGLKALSPTVAQLVVTASGPMQCQGRRLRPGEVDGTPGRHNPDPEKQRLAAQKVAGSDWLALDFTGTLGSVEATPDPKTDDDHRDDSPVVRGLWETGGSAIYDNSALRLTQSETHVVLALAPGVTYAITSQDGADGGMTYLITLQQPPAPIVPGSGTSLAGKVIVVDPGHGAQDSGAVGLGGVREKDLTLAIGLRLRDTLTRAGATVFMTREGDTFLPVMARPRLAVMRQADYFVSIHCDSSGGDNSHTGTTVYYHAHDPVCRQFAADVSRRVAEASGIPRDGARTDTVRFAAGFGVLRGSPMPAILVECGYVNSADDLRKLQDDDTKQRIAEGIVAGLRDFAADTAAAKRQGAR